MGTKDWGEQWALIGQQLAKHGNSKSQSASKSWWGQAGTWSEGGGEGARLKGFAPETAQKLYLIIEN